MTRIPLKHSAWFGDKTVEVALPPEWETMVHAPSKAVAVAPDVVRKELSRLVETLRSRLPATGGRAALIVDDISRPTPVGPVVAALVDELERVGVRRLDTSIIVAGGTHGKMPEELLRIKLGDEIFRSCKVIFHDPWRHLSRHGKTLNSIPILANEILGRCDLRIGIGGVYPHNPAGFGGGAKIILGVCGFKTIAQLHYRLKGADLGGTIDNDFRRELIEIARAVRLDGSVNLVIDDNREITGIYAGDLVGAHEAAVELARKLYTAPPPDKADIIIANTYPFDTTFLFSKKGWWPASRSRSGSSNIIVGSFPLGLGHHGLHPILDGKWKRVMHRAKVYSCLPAGVVAKKTWEGLRRLSRRGGGQRMPAADLVYFRPESAVPVERPGLHFENSWDSVLKRLIMKYQGKAPRVAVYTCAGMQYPAAEPQDDRGRLAKSSPS